jgi:hypothetical protein
LSLPPVGSPTTTAQFYILGKSTVGILNLAEFSDEYKDNIQLLLIQGFTFGDMQWFIILTLFNKT